MIKLATLLFGVLLGTSMAGAVSRVGGGTLSNDLEGFTAKIADGHFLQEALTYVLPDNGIHLQWATMIGFGDNGFMPFSPIVDVYLVRNVFNELANESDREMFRRFFVKRDWQETTHKNQCVEAFEYSGNDTKTIVLGWGDGKGIVIVGQSKFSVLSKMQTIVDTLTLESGACSWK